MSRRIPGRLAQTVIGLVVGMILAQPVAAIPVTKVGDTSVTSIKGIIESTKQTVAQVKLVSTQDISLARQIAEYAKVANRWVTTVNHYTREIVENVRQFTTLKGILGMVEQQLGLDDDTLKALADIGEAIRGVITLKNNFESLVRTRLIMLQNIERRARSGIFDPSADLQDLEEYLKGSVGLSAQNTIASRARLAQFDNELERWTYDLGRLRARKAAIEAELKTVKDGLDAEVKKKYGARDVAADDQGNRVILRPDGTRVSASAEAFTNLTMRRNLLEQQLLAVETEINKLIGLITERYKTYHMIFDESKITAENWLQAQESWDRFGALKDKALDKTIDNYGKPQPPLAK